MECSYSKGILEIMRRIDQVRENVIEQLMIDNEITIEEVESGAYKVEVSGNRVTENFRLLDKDGKYIDGYKVVCNYSGSNVRVQVVKL